MSEFPPIKKGATFRARIAYELEGTPEVVDVDDLKAQVRRLDGAKVADLTILPVAGQVGVFDLEASTAAWPEGQLEFDVRRLEGVDITFSGSVLITVIASRTK